jgi:hypothetical protein
MQTAEWLTKAKCRFEHHQHTISLNNRPAVCIQVQRLVICCYFVFVVNAVKSERDQ